MWKKKRFFNIGAVGGWASQLGSVIISDTDKEIKSSENLIARICGFDNADEYNKCYPGGFKVGSGAWNEIVGSQMIKTPNGLVKLKDANKEIQESVGICDGVVLFHEWIDTKDPHNIPAAVGWNSNQYGSMFLIAPTIKEAKTMPGWKNAKYDDFWWCEDYKEHN